MASMQFPVFVSGVSFVIGAILMATAQSVVRLVIGRMFLGVGVGLASLVGCCCSSIHVHVLATEQKHRKVFQAEWDASRHACATHMQGLKAHLRRADCVQVVPIYNAGRVLCCCRLTSACFLVSRCRTSSCM